MGPLTVELPSLPDWGSRLILAAVTIACALVASWILRVLVSRWARKEPSETGDLVRLRRRETAAALLSTAIRYALFLVAIFAIVGIFVRDRLTAVGGATVIALTVAFSAQRLLGDVISGFFILFENQYGVGDFVEVEPSKYSGVVEEFGLRTTVLRDLNGDRYYIPNGQITGVKRSMRRYRTYSVELMTHDPDRTVEAVEEIAQLAPVGGARFLRPPRVAERREATEGLWLIRVRADVPPTMEWLAEEFLVESLKERLGDVLVGDPIALALDEAAVRRYRRTVVVR